MSEMVESVAIAIGKVARGRYGFEISPDTAFTAARAAIAAMREPTEEMKGAFWEKSGVWIEEGNDRVAEIWNAMLDAALAEPGTPVLQKTERS